MSYFHCKCPLITRPFATCQCLFNVGIFPYHIFKSCKVLSGCMSVFPRHTLQQLAVTGMTSCSNEMGVTGGNNIFTVMDEKL